ncbi:hypothetical protein KAH81_10240 [bacterium]|nr:hypothetical protein [bacterium]
MVIKETTIFTELIVDLMDDNEYSKLQSILVINPKAGPVIKGTGGLRKLRWGYQNKGKRSGLRIIYYSIGAEDQIYMLLIYKKSEQTDLTAEEKKFLKRLVEEENK